MVRILRVITASKILTTGRESLCKYRDSTEPKSGGPSIEMWKRLITAWALRDFTTFRQDFIASILLETLRPPGIVALDITRLVSSPLCSSLLRAIKAIGSVRSITNWSGDRRLIERRGRGSVVSSLQEPSISSRRENHPFGESPALNFRRRRKFHDFTFPSWMEPTWYIVKSDYQGERVG